MFRIERYNHAGFVTTDENRFNPLDFSLPETWFGGRHRTELFKKWDEDASDNSVTP